MLKNISPLISPELLKILSEMGHGDEIVLADSNFPAKSTAAGHEFVRADGIGVLDLLHAILPLFPLDTYDKENFLLHSHNLFKKLFHSIILSKNVFSIVTQIFKNA